MQKPTLRELTEAHAAADLCGTLADAMRTPVLARCLEITALALARPRTDRYRPPPAAPPSPAEPSALPAQTTTSRRDYKRASAADTEE